jgi:hypothetical protein
MTVRIVGALGYGRLSSKSGIRIAVDIGASHLPVETHEVSRSSNGIVAITNDLSPTLSWRPGASRPIYRPGPIAAD